jgi:cell volume regulation protein A
MAEIIISPESRSAGKKIIDLGFPQNARIALLKRDEKYLIPDGQTIIKPGDKIILLAGTKEILSQVTGGII